MVLTAVVDFDFVVSCIPYGFFFFFFFFQAEDGIRDLTVTGVQTCALPISSSAGRSWARTDATQRSVVAPPSQVTTTAAVRTGSHPPAASGAGAAAVRTDRKSVV